MPEPWGPWCETSQPPSVKRRTPRLNSRRPARLRIGSTAVAVTQLGNQAASARPSSRAPGGRTDGSASMRGDRIAGQAEERARRRSGPRRAGGPAASPPARSRCAPMSAEHALDEVVVADRDAAGGEHDVGRSRGLEQALAEDLAARRARCRGRAPRRRHRLTMPPQREAVRVVDLAGACAACRAPRPRRRWRGARRAAAGGLAPAAKPSDATRPSSCGRSTVPARSTTAPGLDVLAARAHVRAARSTGRRSIALAGALDDLLRIRRCPRRPASARRS